MRVLLVDNYDSFTFNLAQAMSALGAEVTVLRADDPALDGALDARPDRLVVSPGPGRPEAAGRSPRLVRAAPERGIPTFGVCLGPAVRGDRVRRFRRARARAAARQDLPGPARRSRRVRGRAGSDRGDPIPLADGRRGDAAS